MAQTPSKDYRRKERERKKADKRRAREEAKAKKLAANPSPPGHPLGPTRNQISYQ
jgi:hypothetical protein